MQLYQRFIAQSSFLRTAYAAAAGVAVCGGIVVAVAWYNTPPPGFPTGEAMVIEQGMSGARIAQYLEERNAVRSSWYVRALFAGRHVQAGVYRFPAPRSARALSDALVRGTYAAPLIRITVPEGMSGATMVPLITAHLPDIALTADMLDRHIGYLFPDTYFVSEDTTADELIALMRDNFKRRTASLAFGGNPSGLTAHEVIILASIVEREANTPQTKRRVAGILHSRLAIDMPLQVDAVFHYLLGKTSAELTVDDLASDTPFNTYTNRGLPPTPIANPSITAIEAVLSPLETDYLFYLTGNDGRFYYARTHDEHVRNKARYLR